MTKKVRIENADTSGWKVEADNRYGRADMTIDEIIKLASAAGFQIETDWAGRPALLVTKEGGVFLRGAHEIVRFYHIVRNATLEECASEFEGQYTDSCPGTNISAAIRAMKGQS